MAKSNQAAKPAKARTSRATGKALVTTQKRQAQTKPVQPMSPRQLRTVRRSALFAGLACLGLLAGLAVWTTNLPGRMWLGAAASVAGLGLEVKSVSVEGLKNMPKLDVYRAALNGPTNSMLGLDVDEARARVLELPWVADAKVRRVLPDQLHIQVSERTPFALWQDGAQLVVIDPQGLVLDTRQLRRFARLPLLSGPSANVQAKELWAAIAPYPELAGQVVAAAYIGQRRWDVRFKTGEELALPEGRAAMDTALATFDRMNNQTRLLGKGFARFDMRLPDKLVVRKATPDPASFDAPAASAPVSPTSSATGHAI